MNSKIIQHVFAIYDDLESGGYEDFMNYAVCKSLLANPDSNFAKLYDYVIDSRPNMDSVNLVCTLNGALCYIATKQMALSNAIPVFDSHQKFDNFIGENNHALRDVLLIKSNNPTIPQRAMSIACHLPKENEIGLLELGCSRGDIGLVLLDLERILKARQDYFFDDFNKAVKEAELRNAVGVNKYFGLDINTSIDDEWLIALWGLKDFRREKLHKFYKDFLPTDKQNFKRIEADACGFQEYIDVVTDYFAAQKYLVILTSFMVYQLTYEKRKDLLHAIKAIQSKFLQLGADKNTIWLDQGAETRKFMTTGAEFNRCYVSRFWFEKGGLMGQPLARLRNDACEGWVSLNDEPIMVHENI